MYLALTPTQHNVLRDAIEQTADKVEWLPPNVRGIARKHLLAGLAKSNLIVAVDSGWQVTPLAYSVLGLPLPTVALVTPDTPTPKPRPDTKQAMVIALLQREEGATVAELCSATGWQAHTVRGFFVSGLKKRLGYTLTSTKAEQGGRVYRIEQSVE